MHPRQRREALLVLLAKQGFAPYAELAEKLGVSEMTVRRDIAILQEQGMAEKVAGGGQVAGSAVEPAFTAKRMLQQEEKRAIALAALPLIEPGMTVGLSSGTTTWTLARHIKGFQNLVFVTNSTNIALDLNQNGWRDIVLTGGYFRTPSDALVGPLAEAALRRLHIDLFFLGVHGIDLKGGISTPNLAEASVNRVMMEQAERVAVLFDHTKWGVKALACIAAIDEVDVLVTDGAGGAAETAAAAAQGIRVIVGTMQSAIRP